MPQAQQIRNDAQAPSSAPTDLVDALLDEGAAALSQGRLAEARTKLEEALRLEPGLFDALHLLGVIAMQEHDLPRAIELIGQAIADDDEVAMAHLNLGLAWLESGQPASALGCFEKALALEPGYPEAQFGRGVALLGLRRHEEAIESLSRHLQSRPGNAEAFFHQGHALLELRRHEEALAAYERTLALQPAHTAALINRGHALAALGRHGEALSSYERSIALQPDRPAAHAGCGDACLALGYVDQALEHYDHALALQPDHPTVHANRGIALSRAGRLEEAVDSYRLMLAGNADHAPTLANLGGALRDLERWEDALPCCERAVQIAPELAGAHMNLGNVMLDLGRVTHARQAFARSVALDPEDAEAQWAQGWCDLLSGDWQRGLPQLEWRWKKSTFTSPRRGFAQPLWLGDTDVRGRTLLLHAEQGLGDTLQFCRYAPLLAEQGARVLLEVQPALRGLMASLPGVAQVLSQGEAYLPTFDLHCPLMSLPLAFKNTPSSLHAPRGYLRASPAMAAVWEARLGPRKAPRVGLVWSGNAAHRNDRHRSVPLQQLLSALPAGLELVCLQKEIRPADLALLNAHGGVQDVRQHLHTFDDTAALAEQMDLVISVDTSVARLAAALGKPTWILLPKMPDWRWLLQREDSPWYPSVRLLRQKEWGQWAHPLDAMRQGLERELLR